MKKILAVATIPVLLLTLTGCSVAKPFGGNCDSLKIDVQEMLKTLKVIDGSFSDGLAGKQQPIWDAGFENINEWVDKMTSYNGNLQAVITLGKSTPAEEAVLEKLLEDLDSDKFGDRLDSDDLSWYRDTKADLDSVAKICGF
jgi:hypothetical protein